MSWWLITTLTISSIIFISLIAWAVTSYRRNAKESQDRLSDRDLLLLMSEEPDRIVSAANLAKKTGLTKSQASMRLSKLSHNGLVNYMSSGFNAFYELKRGIDSKDLLQLSNNPFISIEDLFALFEHFEHKMDMQDICVATGLPFKVIKREMKYFHKEGIIHEMFTYSSDGMSSNRFYTLQDSYKGKRENEETRNKEINLDLENIYREEADGNDFV